MYCSQLVLYVWDAFGIAQMSLKKVVYQRANEVQLHEKQMAHQTSSAFQVHEQFPSQQRKVPKYNGASVPSFQLYHQS